MLFEIASVFIFIQTSLSARILGFFPTPSISHQVVYQPIWKELALRGHQVTAISTDILGENITNLREIDISHAYEFFRRVNIQKKFSSGRSPFIYIHEGYDLMEQLIIDEFENPEVAEIIKSDKEFDLVLVEAFNPLAYAFAGKFGVPSVGISSVTVPLNGHDAVGNPTHPIITPEAFFDLSGDQTFWDRLESVAYSIYFRLIYHYYWIPRWDKVARKYFGDDIPYLGDLERNVSLMLLNVNPLMQTVRPNVPAVIELTQLHIKADRRPLPNDLKKYLDEAKEGFIYFSLGSNVKSANLDPAVRQVILEALGDLPYKVLWKWETDHLPGQPQNVKIYKWLPQQEVLGHPNIKAFVTQGGVQSIEESLSNGVPMVIVPFLGDQPANAMKMVKVGVAKQLHYASMTKDELKEAILEVATDGRYKETAIEAGSILTDVPMKGLEKAVWWIEYVLRHKGAAHIVSPTRDIVYWKYFCLDVIGFLIFVTIFFGFIAYKTVGKLVRCFRANEPKKKYE